MKNQISTIMQYLLSFLTAYSIDYAEDKNVDLIVVGTREESDFK